MELKIKKVCVKHGKMLAIVKLVSNYTGIYYSLTFLYVWNISQLKFYRIPTNVKYSEIPTIITAENEMQSQGEVFQGIPLLKSHGWGINWNVNVSMIMYSSFSTSFRKN